MISHQPMRFATDKKDVTLIPKIKKNSKAQQLFRTDSNVDTDGATNILGV